MIIDPTSPKLSCDQLCIYRRDEDDDEVVDELEEGWPGSLSLGCCFKSAAFRRVSGFRCEDALEALGCHFEDPDC